MQLGQFGVAKQSDAVFDGQARRVSVLLERQAGNVVVAGDDGAQHGLAVRGGFAATIGLQRIDSAGSEREVVEFNPSQLQGPTAWRQPFRLGQQCIQAADIGLGVAQGQ